MKEGIGPEGPETNVCESNSTSAQRARLLDYLKEVGALGVTTIYARENLDIMAPAPRVFELRHHHDCNIQTVSTWEQNAQGNKHRNARYVLFPGSYKEQEGVHCNA